jgi:hypothetical protein
MSKETSRVFSWKSLLMPNNERVVIAFGYQEGETLSLYDSNHNIFRLDGEGKVIWQVRRDDRGKLNLEEWNQRASRGEVEEWREPFMGFALIHPDGRVESADSMTWKPGCVVKVSSINGQDYELDVDTGIIVNVTPHRQRPW